MEFTPVSRHLVNCVTVTEYSETFYHWTPAYGNLCPVRYEGRLDGGRSPITMSY